MQYKSTLNGAINSSVEIITVNSKNGLPRKAGNYHLLLDDLSGNIEIVKVLSADGYNLLVVRGQGGTTARSWSDASSIRGYDRDLVIPGTNTSIVTDLTAQTIKVSATGSASNSFATIAVSGQSNVVADSSTDTLTLVAGTNITLTTNATTDTITIASSSGSPSGITALTGDITASGSGSVAASIAAEGLAKIRIMISMRI